MKQPVTKEQYEFYQSLYDQEERTSIQLEGRAKVYLGIVSAFLAAMILKAPDAEATAKSLQSPGSSAPGGAPNDHCTCPYPLVAADP